MGACRDCFLLYSCPYNGPPCGNYEFVQLPASVEGLVKGLVRGLVKGSVRGLEKGLDSELDIALGIQRALVTLLVIQKALSLDSRWVNCLEIHLVLGLPQGRRRSL